MQLKLPSLLNVTLTVEQLQASLTLFLEILPPRQTLIKKQQKTQTGHRKGQKKDTEKTVDIDDHSLVS